MIQRTIMKHNKQNENEENIIREIVNGNIRRSYIQTASRYADGTAWTYIEVKKIVINNADEISRNSFV